MNTFTAHTLNCVEKTWDEAELHCQVEGGHLASLGTEEEHQQVADMVGWYSVWIGGRYQKEKEEWGKEMMICVTGNLGLSE